MYVNTCFYSGGSVQVGRKRRTSFLGPRFLRCLSRGKKEPIVSQEAIMLFASFVFSSVLPSPLMEAEMDRTE